VENTNAAANTQTERIDNKLNTKIDIGNIEYEPIFNPDLTTIYITNVGSKKLEPAYVDIFIDDVKIPRDNANRIMWFVNETNIANPLHWDPDEILGVNVSLDLDSGPHVVVVATQYGITDSKGFIS
jgi:archaellum component FlaG (FlaF/FlaG flagellin family)